MCLLLSFRQLKHYLAIIQVFVLALGVNQVHADAPVRALDLAYGNVLYEYYQGHAFEALSALNVAKVKGGIKGHGDHPALVEGGLMLSYGMTKEARKLFESILFKPEMKDQVSQSERNQAWFYLGKVFYLEQDYPLALETFNKVNLQILQQVKPELFNELLYLKGQVSYLSQGDGSGMLAQINALPEGNIWQSYLRYNQAVLLLTTHHKEEAIKKITALVNTLDLQLQSVDALRSEDEQVEIRALKERCLLSLGQLYLQQSKVQDAYNVLLGIRKDSIFSDQALFSYAVAASKLEKFGLALEALNQLKVRPLFTPWLQQVPYALAYLYEQLQKPELALEAYRAAVGHYQGLNDKIGQNIESLSEQKILTALNIDPSTQVALEMTKLETDAYGHIKVQPANFNIAALLSTEKFQRELSELHELYKLKFSLGRWEDQLNSFDGMLTIRSQLRTQKIQATTQALTIQHADQWVKQQKTMAANIQTASSNEDAYFFMDQEQIDFYQQIQSVFKSLSDFPEGEEKQQYLMRIKRIQAFFKWEISDRYSVNRWQAEKQMRALKKEVTVFSAHHLGLQQEMASNQRNEKLAARVKDGRERLAKLKSALELSLKNSRRQLVQQVRDDLEKQRNETQNYLVASRKAQARLSDLLYQQRPSQEGVQ